MRNIIVNNELKQLGEIFEYRSGSIVAHRGMIVSFKYEYNSLFLPYSRETLLSRAQVKYVLKITIKTTEQLIVTNPGISSSPTDLESFSLLMSLQISASEIGARDKNSDNCKRGGEVHRPEVIIYRLKMLSESTSSCTGPE
jgi:hypothetical protein